MASIIRQPTIAAELTTSSSDPGTAHPKAHCIINSAELAFDQPVDGIWRVTTIGVLVNLEVGWIPFLLRDLTTKVRAFGDYESRRFLGVVTG